MTVTRQVACVLAACPLTLLAADRVTVVNSAFEDSKTGVPPGWTLGCGEFALRGSVFR